MMGTLIATPVTTGFKDHAGEVIHLFGARVGRLATPLSLGDIFDATGRVVVRDDIIEGTVGIPCSLKTGDGPKVIQTFQQTSAYSQSNGGELYNYDVTDLCVTPFIGLGERVHYTDWRMRAVWRAKNYPNTINANVFTGSCGSTLQGLSGQMYHILTSDGQDRFILSADFTVGQGTLKNFQIELGFGGHSNAIATATRIEGGADWPPFAAEVLTET